MHLWSFVEGQSRALRWRWIQQCFFVWEIIDFKRAHSEPALAQSSLVFDFPSASNA